MDTVKLKQQKQPKKGWLVVSARIPPDLRDWLRHKHSNEGAVNNLIHSLLDNYRKGKIIVRLEI